MSLDGLFNLPSAGDALWGNWDGLGMLASVWGTTKGLSVDQEFQRKLAAIDYKIQLQQLQREDIRDLVELTTGRMDMYHVVGTLLLTFVVQWYTDNGVLQAGLPPWYLSLFFISNFAGVAYLIFSVWLAMHASVASHSIGVRLLTSHTRLTIPSRKDLQNVRVPVINILDNFLNMGSKVLGAVGIDVDEIAASASRSHPAPLPNSAGSASSSAPQSSEIAAMPSYCSGTELANRSTTGTPAPPQIEPIEVLTTEIDEEKDEERRHFRRFLHEQRKWLSYDAHSRLCMSFGMNQTLQALAYYILGVIFEKSPSSALASFFAVKMLAILLLKLDIRTHHGLHWHWAFDVVLFAILHVAPPIFAVILLHLDECDTHECLTFEAILAVPCFLLHAGWLVYLCFTVLKGTLGTASGDGTPCFKSLRVAGYLNVLDVEQVRTVEKARMQEKQERLSAVKEAQIELQMAMQECIQGETLAGKYSATSRKCPKVAAAHTKLANLVHAARDGMKTPNQEPGELRFAEEFLDYVAIWQKAPQMLAALNALRTHKGNLKEEQKQPLELAYATFVAKCKELGLSLDTGKGRQISGGSDGRGVRSSGLMRTNTSEMPAVRVDYDADVGVPASVWVTGKTDADEEYLSETPPLSTSFCDALNSELPKWLERANATIEQGIARERRDLATAGMDDALQRMKEKSMKLKDVISHAGSPEEQLPGDLVKWLTLGTALWWVATAIAAPIVYNFQSMAHGNSTARDFNQLQELTGRRQLSITWNGSPGFLHINALSCNDSVILAGTEFSMFVGKKLASDSVAFADLHAWPSSSESATSAALFGASSSGSCDVLSQASSSSWVLTPLGASTPQEGLHVPVPASWRVVTAWAPKCSMPPCGETKLAGWDGNSVVVGALKRDTESMLSVQPRFRVQLGRGRCVGDVATCHAASQQAKYDNVTALQFGSAGQTLKVLLGDGYLDAWDLRTSALLGRWRLNNSYTALCRRRRKLLFARDSEDGPALEEFWLPRELEEAEIDLVEDRTEELALRV